MIGVFNRAKRVNRFENTTTLCSEKNHGTNNQQLLSRYFQRFCPRYPILQQRTNISILIVTTTITMHRCDNTQKATANTMGYRTGWLTSTRTIDIHWPNNFLSPTFGVDRLGERWTVLILGGDTGGVLGGDVWVSEFLPNTFFQTSKLKLTKLGW